MCGISRFIVEGVPGIKGSKKMEANQGTNVVHGLLDGLENRGHIVVMDNIFLRCPYLWIFWGKTPMQRTRLGPIV
jgi:hypothetical protein